MAGRSHLFTIECSTTRERIWVTEIGLRWLMWGGWGVLGIGLTIAVSHWEGTLPLNIEPLKHMWNSAGQLWRTLLKEPVWKNGFWIHCFISCRIISLSQLSCCGNFVKLQKKVKYPHLLSGCNSWSNCVPLILLRWAKKPSHTIPLVRCYSLASPEGTSWVGYSIRRHFANDLAYWRLMYNSVCKVKLVPVPGPHDSKANSL